MNSITVSPSPDHHFEQNQQLAIIMPLIIVLSCVFIVVIVIVIVVVVYCRRRNNQLAHVDNVNDKLLQHNEIEMQEYPAFLSIDETEL